MYGSQNILLSWVPIAAVFVALFSLISQNRRAKFSQGIDLLLKFEDKFNSQQMRTARKSAAKSLQKGADSEVDDVLDFFETLGMLVQKDALDKEMVWNTFFYWVHLYWFAASEYLSTQRKDDPSTWEEFVYLYKCVAEVEKHRTHCSESDLSVSKESIEEFLNEEANL